MYSFEPDEEQKMLVDTIHRYAADDLYPHAREAEEVRQFPLAVVEKGWEIGVLQTTIPENFGGFGDRSAVTGVLAAEELAWGDLAGAMALMTPNLYALPILIAGNQTQKETYLPLVVEANWKPYTAALIEPTFSFDPNDLQTIALDAGDVYILTGEKTFVPYAPDAKEMVIFANLAGATQGFIVRNDSENLVVGERNQLLGINGLPTYELRLNELRIPKEHRLGGLEGHDLTPVLASANIGLAAMGVGVARAAYEYSRDYAKDREVFGVKVAQKQAIAFMLAEMATEIEAIRLLNWEAAWMVDSQKEDAFKHTYLALSGAMDLAMKVTDRAVQILGGHGYIREHPVELWMRNGRGIATLNGLAMV